MRNLFLVKKGPFNIREELKVNDYYRNNGSESLSQWNKRKDKRGIGR